MKNVIQSLLNKYATDVDYIEVRLEDTKGLSIIFKGKHIDTLDYSLELGGCVRALVKGGWGFSSFNNLNNLENHMKMAIQQAQIIGNSVSSLAPVPAIQDHVTLEVDVDPRDVSLDKKISILKDYNDLMLQYPGVTTSSVRYFDKFTEWTFANSEGSYIVQEKMDLGCGMTPIAQRDGQNQMLSVGAGSTNSFNALLGKEKSLQEACRIAVALLDAPRAKSGVYTVVCDKRLSGIFVHEAFGHTSEADKVCEDKQFAEIMKLGKKFGKPILNIFDTGIEVGSRGSLKYDDEGVQTEKTYLIKDGILVGRLHTRETAAKRLPETVISRTISSS